MYANHNWHVHMDEEYMHRVYLEDPKGKTIGRSKSAFNDLAAANQALAAMMYSAVMRSEAA